MARKSVPVGDMIEMDRAQIFHDVDEVKRKLLKALWKRDENERKGLLQAAVKEIEGEQIVP